MSASAQFNETFYLTNNADVVVAISQGFFGSALQHYNQFGGKELRAPNATFDPNYYAVNNPDVLNAVASGVFPNVFEHYKEFGESENRAPTEAYASFDAAAYLEANADVAAAVTAGSFASALDHFIAFGQAEQRAGSGVTADAGAVGSNFTLSTGADTITGTANNDTFVAGANNLLQTGDTLDGGAGTDTITSRHTITDGLDINPVMTNIENHIVRIDHDGGAADAVGYNLSDSTGVSSVKLDRLNNTGTTADAVVTVSGSGYAQTVVTEISGGDTGADNNAIDITLTYNGAAGSGDSASLILDGAAANVLTITGMETVNIDAQTNDTTASSTGATELNSFQSTTTTALNITGAGAVNLSGATGAQVAANMASSVTVNASANTGGVTMLSEANTLTFTGGSGADAIYMAGTMTSADTLTGGEGRDTLGLTADVSAANGAAASGFEILDLVGSGAATYDMDDYANSTFDTIAISGSLNGDVTVTVNDIVDGSTLKFGGTEAMTNDDDMTISVKNAGTAGQTNNTINVEIAGTAAVAFGTLTAPNIENVNITAGGAATGNSIAILTTAAARTLTITGESALTISAFTGSSAITNYDTSGMTGAFVMGAAGQSTSATLFTGGAGADTFIGNSGDDILNAGGGTTNSLTGGAGDDTYNLGDGTDTVGQTGTGQSTARTAQSIATAGSIAAGDTITFGNGLDVVNNFNASGDLLDVTTPGTFATIIGQDSANLDELTTFFASGAYNSTTGVFSIAANGTGADTLILENSGTAAEDVLSTATTAFVLVGVDSDDLTTADLT